MKVLLVGAGGREHALAWRIAQSESLEELYVLAHNPGWPESAVVLAGDPVDVAISAGVDLVVVGPEGPLADGIADRLNAAGIPCFGPTRAAARLEASKAFCKDVMIAAGVPTGGYEVFETADPVQVERARHRCAQGDVVLKADGLAAGKGVYVCESGLDAVAALDEMLAGRFGDATSSILLEELLVGPEISVFALTDGERVVPLLSAQDHKRLLDGDLGPNTGGMGAYAPCPLLTEAEVAEVVTSICLPVVQELASRGTPYRGVLYAGLMLTDAGVKVLEFNVRFGDPECQALMALWDDDILPWLLGAATGSLPDGTPRFAEGAACVVVLASAGYPRTSTKGVPIPESPEVDGVQVFYAGARRDDDGALRTNGGRVLGVTGVGDTIRSARDAAYRALPGVLFDGAQSRADIAAQALA
jgi:phosphoribosylamine--glycine ligase